MGTQEKSGILEDEENSRRNEHDSGNETEKLCRNDWGTLDVQEEGKGVGQRPPKGMGGP